MNLSKHLSFVSKVGQRCFSIRYIIYKSQIITIIITTPSRVTSENNKPVHQNDLPRPAGIASFMRLPVNTIQETAGLDACIVGVPVDTATSNRPGTRFGPREIRTESVMVRPRLVALHRRVF